MSYVAVHPQGEESDPDGLDHKQRMSVEENAIAAILSLDRNLKRTPPNNAGFDLFEENKNGEAIRWVEVKAMTGSLENRPVGLSCTQFNYALSKRKAYWLYIVEFANDPERICLRRIQDPAGLAKTYTFDKGWSEIALSQKLLC